MTRPRFALALLCLTGLAAAGSCVRVSLEPGSAAARPVTFQVSIELPDAPPDGTATWDAVLPPTIAWSTQGDPPSNATISHTLTGTPAYRWYLNGKPMDGKTNDTLSVGGAGSDTGVLAIGIYRLSAVVAADGALATVDWVFEVTDE